MGIVPGPSASEPFELRRRHLLLIGTGQYERSDIWPALDIESELTVWRSWLADPALGARRFVPLYPQLADNPTAGSLFALLSTAEIRPRDALVAVLTGHGEVIDGAHRLVLRSGDRRRPNTTMQRTDQLIGWLAETGVEHALVVIDTCQAGQVAESVLRLDRELPNGWIGIATAAPTRQARLGAVSNAVAEFLSGLGDQDAAGGPYLSTLDFVRSISDTVGSQDMVIFPRFPRTGPSPCLPNPRFAAVARPPERSGDPTPAVRLDDAAKAPGPAGPAAVRPPRLFSDRPTLVGTLVEALRRPGVTVLSGAAGSGKSAVLRHLAEREAEPGARPVLFVDAAGRTAAELWGAIAAAVDAVLDTVEPTDAFRAAEPPAAGPIRPAELRARLGNRGPALVVDSLDEAVDPFGTLTDCLTPLAEDWSQPGFPMVLGVRSAEVVAAPAEDGDDAAPTLAAAAVRTLNAREVRADRPPYFVPGDLTGYVRTVLLGAPGRPTVYSDRPASVDAFAARIGELAGTSFVTAELAARALAEAEVIRDPEDPQWQASVLAGLAAVVGAELAREFKDPVTRRRITAMLQAAALSLGPGVPRRFVWPAMASALAPAPEAHGPEAGLIDRADIDGLLRSRAGGYLAARSVGGETVYRPFHESVRPALAFPEDDPAIVGVTAVDRNDPPPGSRAAQYLAVANARITAALRAELDATPPGLSPNEYLRRQAGGHAVAAGRLDDLLDSVAYLVHAEPDALLPLLRHADEAVPVGRLYLQHGHLLRAAISPVGRASILELAAQRAGRVDLADALAVRFPDRPWSARWSRPFTTAAAHLVLDRQDGPVGGVDLQLSADGRVRFFGAGLDGTIRTGEATGIGVAPLATSDPLRPAATSLTVARSRGETTAVTGHLDGSVRIWEVATGRVRTMPEAHSGPVTALSAGRSAAGRRTAVSADGDGRLRLWDLEAGASLGEWSVGAELVGLATGSLQDGRSVVVLAFPDRMQVHDLDRGLRVVGATSPAAEGAPSGATRSSLRSVTYARLAGGRRAAVYGDDRGRIGVWDLDSTSPPDELLELSPTGSPAVAVAVGAGPDGGPLVAAGHADGSVRLGDLGAFVPLGSPLRGHRGPVTTVAVAPRGAEWPVVVSGGVDGAVRSWDLADLARPAAPEGIGPTERDPDGSADRTVTAVVVVGDQVVVGEADGAVSGLAAANGRPLPAFGERSVDSAVTALAVDDAGPGTSAPVAVGGADGTVRVGVDSDAIPSRIAGPVRELCFVRFGPAQTPLLVAAGPGAVTVIDIGSGQSAALTDERDPFDPTRLVTGSDGRGRRVLVAGGTDGAIRVWDLADFVVSGRPAGAGGRGTAITALHLTAVSDAAVALVAADAAGTLRRWNLGAVDAVEEVVVTTGPVITAIADSGVRGRVLLGRQDGRVVPFDLFTGMPAGLPIDLGAPIVAIVRTGVDRIVATSVEVVRLAI